MLARGTGTEKDPPDLGRRGHRAGRRGVRPRQPPAAIPGPLVLLSSFPEGRSLLVRPPHSPGRHGLGALSPTPRAASCRVAAAGREDEDEHRAAEQVAPEVRIAKQSLCPPRYHLLGNGPCPSGRRR